MNQTLFIVNPQAARGLLGKQWGKIAKTLKQSFGHFEVALTGKAGDATRFARDAAKLYSKPLIVSVGGDGTLNECVNGLIADDALINKKSILGILPLGRGSDFARMLGVSRDPKQALLNLKSGEELLVDVGKAVYTNKTGKTQCRYFMNVASLGVSGTVVEYSNKAPKALSPKLSYLYSVFRGIVNYQSQAIEFNYPKSKKQENLLMMLVCNGRYFGSGMNIAPHAKLDDGKLDVTVIQEIGLLDMIRHLPKLYTGSFLSMPQVHTFKTPNIEITPLKKHQTCLVELDGDMVGTLPAKFEVLPRLLKIRA